MRAFVAEALAGRAKHLELGGRVRDPRRLGDVFRLRAECRRFDPEVVHIQDSLPHDMRLALVAGLTRHRYALTVHDPAPHPGDPQPSARIRFLRRTLRRRASLLFAHSEAMARELRELGDARGPIEVVPHGLGPVAATPLPERPSLLFFGRISHYKGVDTLLDAMPLVWERLPDLTLTVAGEGQLPEHPDLADRRLTLRLEHVPEADVPALFAAATCVVLPYRQASQSGVGSEAKRFGRPLVATEVGGLPELVAPGCGRLVPPEDPRALAEAILEVVGTPGLAAAMGRSAAESAPDAGWEGIAAKTLDAYRRVLL
jgi:glycosyltransferase involved in cell wall biosynthesis